MEKQGPKERATNPEVWMEAAKRSYEYYVYLVKCATEEPDDFEPSPEGFDEESLRGQDPKDILARHLDEILRRSLKNVIEYTRISLDIPENVPPGSYEFSRLKEAVDDVIEKADLSDITDAGEPWWGESGAPNPLQFPLNISRVPNERRHRRIPRQELLDNRTLHPAIVSRLEQR